MSSPSVNSRTSLYGWVIVVLAATAMVATLPGRTHGLGMITERLMKDESLQLDRVQFGYINLWATLIGALFCFPVGWMLDRFGLRITSTSVIALLGLVTVGMTKARNATEMAILITLTRGLGQSALSVVSISMTGKWFRKGLPVATAVYSILVSIGFMAAFGWAREMHKVDWRYQWSILGQALLIATPIFALLVRSEPDSVSDAEMPDVAKNDDDFTFQEAISVPAFWVFGIATSLYGLISSGVSLFNESLLVERGFPPSTFLDLGLKTTGIGLLGNLLTGAMATRVSINKLTMIAMGLLAGSLLSLPYITIQSALLCYAVVYAYAGGMVTVIFFTVWARLFGSRQLGRIQAVAQMMTVVASAIGPVILAEMKSRFGSYLPAIIGLGIIAALLAIVVPFVPTPKRTRAEL